MKRSLTITAIFFATIIQSEAQEKVTIDQFAWLTGHWIGDGFGGVSEEIWSEPRGGSMIGLYRHLKEGENNFYEIFSLYEDEGSITFRLKHFNPDMKGWEEKDDFVEFPFISVEDGKAVFNGLIYELTDPDTMIITLKLHSKEKTWEEVFTFKRSKTFPVEVSVK